MVLGCGQQPFTNTAFTSSQAGFAQPSPTSVLQTPALATATTTSDPGSNTHLQSDTTTSPVTPSQTSSSSGGFSSTTTITVVIVAAVVSLVFALVFLWFLYKAWKIHQAHKYPQQYTPVSYQGSTTSLYPGTPVKKSGLSKWSKIVTVISPIFAIAGLGVAIYFGLKQK